MALDPSALETKENGITHKNHSSLHTIFNLKAAIIILNWNGRKMLETFLPSVTQHTTGNHHVIVADNGSTDDSIEFLKAHYPQVQLIPMDKNYGFAGGYNRAIAQIQDDYDYFCLLNDDVEVTDNWIDPILLAMEKDETIAFAQPKLMMYDQKDTFEYAGGAGGFIDKNGYPFCRGRIFTTLEKDHGQYDDQCEVFWATGAALFVKAKVWKELNGLDADFFAHMEEIDFCWRAKNKGYKGIYCPHSVVYHVGGGTLPKSSPRKTYLNFRNNLALLYKNLPDEELTKVMRHRKILDLVAAFKFLASGNIEEFKAVFQARKDFRQWDKKMQEARKQLQPHSVNCIYHRNILLEYYINRRKHFSDLNANAF